MIVQGIRCACQKILHLKIESKIDRLKINMAYLNQYGFDKSKEICEINMIY